MADTSYSAEFVLSLDKLKKGVVDAKSALNDLEKAFIDAGENAGEGLGSALEKGLDSASKALEKAQKDVRAYADVTGDAKGAVEQSIKAHEDYIAALINEAKAHGDTDGKIKGLIASHQKQIKELQKGKGAADGFGKGLKKGFDQAGKEATKFGVNFVKALGPIGLILAVVTAAINFVKEKLGGAIAENEKASKSFEKIGNIIDAVVTPIFNGLAEAIGFVADLITGLIDKFTGGGASAAALAGQTKKAESSIKELDKALRDEIKTVEERNKAYKDDAQYTNESLSAHQKYLDALIAEKAANGDISGGLQERIDKELVLVNELKKQAKAHADAGNTATKAGKESESIIERRKELEKKLNQELAVAGREASRITDSVEKENFLRERQNEIYRDTRGELDRLIVQFGATRDNAEQTFKFADQLDKSIEDTTAKMASEAKIALYIKDQKAAQAEYDEKMRKFQFEKNQGLITEAQLVEERNKAQDEYNGKLSSAVALYNDVEVAAQAANDVMTGEKKFDFEKVSSGLAQVSEYYSQAAGSVLQITQAMAEDQIETINNLLEQQKELIDKQYEDTMALLAEERQAALEAAGFVKAITEEGQAAALEAAMASGDEGLIYKEKRRQEELAINKKFNDAEKKANDDKVAAEKKAEEKAAREIAQIQYRQAMAEWTNSLIQAGVNTAVAITAALAQGANVILAGIVGGLGALQIAAIVANAPKPPAFADGGVVGLPRTYHSTYANGGIVEANTPRGVDAVDTTLANREMVLNDEQQSNLFGAIAGNQLGGGEQPIILYITFNVTKLSDEVVSVINDGLTRKVDVRMVG